MMCIFATDIYKKASAEVDKKGGVETAKEEHSSSFFGLAISERVSGAVLAGLADESLWTAPAR